jgi:lipopolysaccharide biosynthesis regulator YciM
MREALANSGWEIGAAVAVALALGALLFWLARRGRRGGKLQRELDAYADGLASLSRDDVAAAIRALSRAAEINSERGATYLALGRLLRRQKEYGRALQVHQGLALRPDLPSALRRESHREAARDELEAGRPARALEIVQPLLEKDRRDPELLVLAADTYVLLARWEDAYEAHRRLDQVTGKSRPALLAHLLAARGRALIAEGNLSAARKILQKAIDVHPGSADALASLGDAYLAEAKPRRAIEAWEKIGDLDPRWMIWLAPRLEQGYYQTGEVEKLEILLRRMIGRRPEEAALHLVLARHLAKQGRLDDALGVLKQAVDLVPASLPIRRERARLLLGAFGDGSGIEVGSRADGARDPRERGEAGALEAELDALVKALPADPPPFRCGHCGAEGAEPAWRCERCGGWDTVTFACLVPDLPLKSARAPTARETSGAGAPSRP